MNLLSKVRNLIYGTNDAVLAKISLDRNKLIDMSYSEVVMSNLKLGFMSLVISFIFWPIVNHQHLLIWLAVAFFIYAIKIVDAVYFRSHKHEHSASYWEIRFMLMTLAVIVVWNVFIFTFFPHDNLEKQIVLTVFIIMITACGTTALAAYQKFFVPFQLLMLYPLVYAYYQNTEHAWILIAIYTVFVILNSNKIHGILLRSMKTQELQLQQVEFEKNKKIEELLNNSGEAFIVFDENLAIGDLSSATTKEVFGETSGKDIRDVLEIIPSQRDHFKACVEDSFESATQADIFLSLLPQEFNIDKRYFNARYTKLFDQKIMLVLDDATETHELHQKIKRDRTIVDLITNAITDSASFFATIDEYNNFIDVATWEAYDGSGFYRTVHTYKGTFNQLGMVNTADCLHQLEDKIRENTLSVTQDSLRALHEEFDEALHQNLKNDLLRLSQIMGEKFINNRGIIAITPDQAELIEEQLKKSGVLDDSDLDEVTKKALSELLLLRSKSLNTQLHQMESMVVRLGENLDKLIEFTVSGDEVALPNDTIRPLIQQVGHLLRNAVDHGIETVDVREELGKNEVGKIACHLTENANGVELIIEDDGTGIDTERLKQKLQEKDLEFDNEMALIDLIKIDGLSSTDNCTAISGRGMGVGSVIKWVESINGSFEVSTQLGKGSTFTLSIPTDGRMFHI